MCTHGMRTTRKIWHHVCQCKVILHFGSVFKQNTHRERENEKVANTKCCHKTKNTTFFAAAVVVVVLLLLSAERVICRRTSSPIGTLRILQYFVVVAQPLFATCHNVYFTSMDCCRQFSHTIRVVTLCFFAYHQSPVTFTVCRLPRTNEKYHIYCAIRFAFILHFTVSGNAHRRHFNFSLSYIFIKILKM